MSSDKYDSLNPVSMVSNAPTIDGTFILDEGDLEICDELNIKLVGDDDVDDN